MLISTAIHLYQHYHFQVLFNQQSFLCYCSLGQDLERAVSISQSYGQEYSGKFSCFTVPGACITLYKSQHTRRVKQQHKVDTFGQVLVQFMMVWQRYIDHSSLNCARRSARKSSRESMIHLLRQQPAFSQYHMQGDHSPAIATFPDSLQHSYPFLPYLHNEHTASASSTLQNVTAKMFIIT